MTNAPQNPHHESAVINHRFHGPPTSGNGGYVCGLVACAFGPGTPPETPAIEVTLLQPPPLDTPLVVELEPGRVRLLDKGVEIAVGRPAALDLDVPQCPTWDAATAATARYSGFAPFFVPTCFVCGMDREPGDGLCIHAGPLADTGANGEAAVASTWTINPDHTGLDGRLVPEYMYGALDCPGYFAVNRVKSPLTALLGRMTAEVLALPAAGDDCIVIAWRIGSVGRKHDVGTAVFRRDGSLLARARSTWIELRQG